MHTRDDEPHDPPALARYGRWMADAVYLPPKVAAADERRRARLFVVLTLVVFGVTALMLLLIGPAALGDTLPVYVGGMGLMLLNLLARRLGAPLALCSNVLVGIVYAGLATVSLATGAVGLAAPFALATVPMLAILLGTLRSSIGWTLAVFAVPAALAVLHAQGVAFPIQPDPAAETRRFLVSLAGVVTLMGLLALLFDWLGRAALRDLSRTHGALDRARSEAQAANKTKTRFLANMSHEIRTPMNGVINMLDVFGDGELRPDQRHSVDVAHRSAQALLHLLNDIVDLAKVEAGALELEQRPFSLERTIREVVEFFSLSAGSKGLTLEFVLDPDAPDGVIGDGFRLRQVLINLVGNAIKFTREGTVTVTLGPISPDVPLPEGADRWIEVAVRDTGIGVDPADIERIFDPFIQADASSTRQHGGTGLGLAISRQLVERMGGWLTAHSVPGEGSTFRAVLPVAVAEHVPEPEVERAGRTVFEGARVLIVEDNPVNRLVVEKLLRAAEIETEAALDGRAGYEMTMGGDFDLVLMDCQMPVMDGYDATRALRATGYNRPIVALTANAMEGDREKCLAAGMDDFLSKPLRRSALLAALHRWLPPTPIVQRAPSDPHGPPSGVFRRPGFLAAYTSSGPMAVPPEESLDGWLPGDPDTDPRGRG